MLAEQVPQTSHVLLASFAELNLAGRSPEDAIGRPIVPGHDQLRHITAAQQSHPTSPAGVEATNIMVPNEKRECPGCDCPAICAAYSTTTITSTANPPSGAAHREILITANGDNIHSASVGIHRKGRATRKNSGNDCPDCDLDSCGCGRGTDGARSAGTPGQAAGIAAGMGCVAAVAAGWLF